VAAGQLRDGLSNINAIFKNINVPHGY